MQIAVLELILISALVGSCATDKRAQENEHMLNVTHALLRSYEQSAFDGAIVDRFQRHVINAFAHTKTCN